MTRIEHNKCRYCGHTAHCGHSCVEETCDHCTECACDDCQRLESTDFQDGQYPVYPELPIDSDYKRNPYAPT